MLRSVGNVATEGLEKGLPALSATGTTEDIPLAVPTIDALLVNGLLVTAWNLDCRLGVRYERGVCTGEAVGGVSYPVETGAEVEADCIYPGITLGPARAPLTNPALINLY